MRSLRYCAVLALMLSLASQGSAQEHATDRGSIQIAGSASLTSSGADGDSDRTTALLINPRVRYFVIPQLALGADATLGYASRGEFSSTTYGIGPAATYYFAAPGSRIHPYLTGSVTFARTEVETLVNDSEQTRTSLAAGGGILAMLSPAVGVTAELFYRTDRDEAGLARRDSDTFGLALGIAAFVF